MIRMLAAAFCFTILGGVLPAAANEANKACYPVTGFSLVAAEAADGWMDGNSEFQERRKVILDEVIGLQKDMSVPLLTLKIDIGGEIRKDWIFRARELSTGHPMLDALVGRGPSVRAAKAEELEKLRPQVEAMLKGMVTRQQLPAEVATAMDARMGQLLGKGVAPGQAARVIGYELRMEHLHKVHQQLSALLATGPVGLERLEDMFSATTWRFVPLSQCGQPNPDKAVTLTFIR